MRSRARVFGHPMHPLLVMFPTALFPLLLVLDVVPRVVETDPGFWAAGFWIALVGLATSLVAAIPGAVDMAAIPDRTRAHKVGVWHAVVGTLVIVAYAAAAWSRWPPGLERYALQVGIDVAGTLLVTVQGFLGGELVYRHALGVHDRDTGGDPTPFESKERARDLTPRAAGMERRR